MTIWRTTFKRYNFDFTPALVQSADVVFETDIPFDNDGDNPEKFERVAWVAMWEQNPNWLNPKGPIPSSGGWSSVSGGNRFVKVSR